MFLISLHRLPVTSITAGSFTTQLCAQHDAQFDYYGKRLATCSSDRSIKVYDVSGSEYKYLAELKGYAMQSGTPAFHASWQRALLSPHATALPAKHLQFPAGMRVLYGKFAGPTPSSGHY